MSRLIACMLLMFASMAHAAEPVLKLQGIDYQHHAPLETGHKKASLLFFVHNFHWQPPTTSDLRDALDAILVGKPVPEPQLAAVGKEIPVLPPPPRTFGMNAIIAIGPVFFIAGLLIPFINGYRGGKKSTSVWMGWWLLIIAAFYFDLFGPALIAHFYGDKVMVALSAKDRGPAILGYMMTGWLPALIFHAIGAVIRFTFDAVREPFAKRRSN